MKTKKAKDADINSTPPKGPRVKKTNPEANEPQVKVHDSGYKKVFSNRTIFQQLIETFIHESWVQELDFSTAEMLNKSFVADHYKATESDLIYQMQLRGKTVYIYILLEFQSKVDRFMVIRVLYYILSFYMDYVRNYSNIEKLPAVFPIVLYNGKEKWTAQTNIQDLIEAEPSLGAYAIHFQHLLLNEKAYSQESLLKIRNIVSTLFLAEGHYDINLLEAELKSLYKREEDKQAVSLLLNWFRQLVLYGKVSPEDYEKLDYVYRSEEEVQSMLVATLEQEKEKNYWRGHRDGWMDGALDGQRKTLLLLLNYRFHPGEEAQAVLAHQLEQINDAQVLTDLTNRGLEATSWNEFHDALLKALPPPVMQPIDPSLQVAAQ